MTLMEKIKDAAGIEGDLKSFVKPMAAYTCANITLGGAGYPIGMYHQQYMNFVEGMQTSVTGTLSMINGLIVSKCHVHFSFLPLSVGGQPSAVRFTEGSISTVCAPTEDIHIFASSSVRLAGIVLAGPARC